MEMSAAEQQARTAPEEMKEAGRQAKGEARSVAREAKHAAQKGIEKLKSRKKPIDAALTAIETASKPVYLGLAAGSIVVSLILYGFRKKEDALFVGLWAPTFLALGLFSKLVSRSSGEKS